MVHYSLTNICCPFPQDGLIWYLRTTNLNGYHYIIKRLEAFVKRYHGRQLLIGSLLFLGLGLLFWIGVLSLEYLLWLGPQWRLVLFWLFIGVELFLLYRFIMLPLLSLLRLRKGLDHKEASLLIGKHFPEVDDKLYNLLELSQQPQKSDLLLASIEQRSQRLGPVPFSKAIDFKDSYKYLKYVMLPLLILGFLWVSGNLVSFFNSHQRLVHYDMAFERPAPFSFVVLNDELRTLDHQDFTLRVGIAGDVRPEYVYLVIDGQQLLMEQRDGVYQYRFEAPFSSVDFYFTANGWNSDTYALEVLPTPNLMDFWMELEFPNYLKRSPEKVKGTGNATVPEGTRVHWRVKGQNVERVSMEVLDSVQQFQRAGELFSHEDRLFNPMNYRLSSSNAHVQGFEPLEYTIDIIKDESAQVLVEQFLDSIHPNQAYYSGQAMDDHGIASISLVYYPLDDIQNKGHLLLERPNSSVHQFYYSFPSGLHLEEGRSYGLYFEIVDNDAIHGGKVTRSQTFSTHVLNDNQLKNRELDFQNSSLGQMDRSLREYKEQQQGLSEINKGQKENTNLSFEDKNQIRNFLERQQQQEALMKKFSNELGESLAKNSSDSKLDELLRERLRRQEEEAQRNADLLEELQRLADKMEKEELQQRLEELGRNQGKNIRNLEQILELTKRYYVTEKSSQLSRELEDLSNRQESLSEEQGESAKEQQQLNEEFQGLDQEVEELEKDNEGLKKPLAIKDSKSDRESIKKDQKDALDQLQKEENSKSSGDNQDGKENSKDASKKQKSAAQKMQEIAESLQMGGGGGGASDAEDAAMLRQILDNLLQFSFKQEELFDELRGRQVDLSHFAGTVRKQQELRRLFEHVDDSLFALSLRRVELSEFVNEQVEEVYYNIDRSLESLAENQMYQGASHQQYTINATNALADFLAQILENMQENLSMGSGGSPDSDFQLPDIIQGQQSIQEKMGNGKEGKKSSQQREGEAGEGGESGQQSQEGQKREGEESNEGKQGDGGQGEELGLNEIYEIYKEQQFLREQLEKQLKDMIDKEDRDLTQKLLRQMEDFQNDLLENGITQRTMAKVNNIQHQLLKLEDATLEQGQEQQRESQSNVQDFTNPIISRPSQLQESRQGIEILNRQALPLRRKYEERVKEYFKND